MPDLLAAAREIFAAPTMTEDDAVTAMRTAHANAGKVAAANAESETAKAELATARTELAGVKDKLAAAEAKVPKPIDADAAGQRIEAACEGIDALVERGCILPPQAAALKGELMPEAGKPNLAAVTASGVVYSHAAVKAALSANKPLGLTGEATGAQQGAAVAKRTVPGTEGQDPGPESVTPARKAELLAMAGMSPTK